MNAISSISMSNACAVGENKIRPIHLIDHMDYSHSDESREHGGCQVGTKEGKRRDMLILPTPVCSQTAYQGLIPHSHTKLHA